MYSNFNILTLNTYGLRSAGKQDLLATRIHLLQPQILFLHGPHTTNKRDITYLKRKQEKTKQKGLIKKGKNKERKKVKEKETNTPTYLNVWSTKNTYP